MRRAIAGAAAGVSAVGLGAIAFGFPWVALSVVGLVVAALLAAFGFQMLLLITLWK